MKYILTILLSIITVVAFGQQAAEDEREIRPNYDSLSWSKVEFLLKRDGYFTINGFNYKIGDKLKLGVGSMDTKSFLYIYESETPFYKNKNNGKRINLTSKFSNKDYTITKFVVLGSKNSGYKIVAEFQSTTFSYWCEIENALITNELKK